MAASLYLYSNIPAWAGQALKLYNFILILISRYLILFYIERTRFTYS